MRANGLDDTYISLVVNIYILYVSIYANKTQRTNTHVDAHAQMMGRILPRNLPTGLEAEFAHLQVVWANS